MAALIDASVLTQVEHGGLPFAELAAHYAQEQMAISAITAAELLHGVHRARNASQRARREAFLEAVIARLPVISFDLVVARVHALLWADLARRGALVGERDLMIGATAIARGYALATKDRRSFPKIPGLKVELL